MNKEMLKEKIFAAAGSLLYEKGFVSSVDFDRLSLKDYEAWRRRQVPYLEKVLVGSLGKLSTIMFQAVKDAFSLIGLRFFHERPFAGCFVLRVSKTLRLELW